MPEAKIYPGALRIRIENEIRRRYRFVAERGIGGAVRSSRRDVRGAVALDRLADRSEHRGFLREPFSAKGAHSAFGPAKVMMRQ